MRHAYPGETGQGNTRRVTTASPDAVTRLAQRYPELPRAHVAAVLQHANETVAYIYGHPDPGMAEDLAQIRLDVQTERYM